MDRIGRFERDHGTEDGLVKDASGQVLGTDDAVESILAVAAGEVVEPTVLDQPRR
jgi:hypothetical protein